MSGDIELCASGGDVELCLERDIELCAGCEELILTGDESIDLWKYYTASGGSGTLTFTFDSGTFSQDGNTIRITSIDGCSTTGSDRIGIITVTDECPEQQSAEIVGRLPGGEWVADYIEWFAPEDDAGMIDACCFVIYEFGTAWLNVQYEDSPDWFPALFSSGDGGGYYVRYANGWDGGCSASNDCSFCGEPNESEGLFDCYVSITSAMPTTTEGVYPNAAGSPAIVRDVNDNDGWYRVLYNYHMKWVCS